MQFHAHHRSAVLRACARVGLQKSSRPACTRRSARHRRPRPSMPRLLAHASLAMPPSPPSPPSPTPALPPTPAHPASTGPHRGRCSSVVLQCGAPVWCSSVVLQCGAPVCAARCIIHAPPLRWLPWCGWCMPPPAPASRMRRRRLAAAAVAVANPAPPPAPPPPSHSSFSFSRGRPRRIAIRAQLVRARRVFASRTYWLRPPGMPAPGGLSSTACIVPCADAGGRRVCGGVSGEEAKEREGVDCSRGEAR